MFLMTVLETVPTPLHDGLLNKRLASRQPGRDRKIGQPWYDQSQGHFAACCAWDDRRADGDTRRGRGPSSSLGTQVGVGRARAAA